MMSLTRVASAAPAMVSLAALAEPARPVVIELFTSEGCSSCPPADAFLTDVARSRSDVLPLGFHVTYWNDLGWHDPYSLQAATNRQSRYADSRGGSSVFTPELVVEETQSVVGSRVGAATSAIREAEGRVVTAAPMRIVARADRPDIMAGKGVGHASLVLIGYDPEHLTAVGRGENSGRTLLESNIVRSIAPVGTLDRIAAEHRGRPPGGPQRRRSPPGSRGSDRRGGPAFGRPVLRLAVPTSGGSAVRALARKPASRTEIVA